MEIGGGTEGTAQPSVVYGTYDEDGLNWTPDSTITDPTQTYKNVTYSKTAAPVQGADNTYDITLNVSTTVKKSAVVLVLDTSKDAVTYCDECGRDSNRGHANSSCPYYEIRYQKDENGDYILRKNPRTGNMEKVRDYSAQEVLPEQTFLASEKAAAKEFIENYAGSVANTGKYLQIVSYQGTAQKELEYWVDVSTQQGKAEALAAIDALAYNDADANAGKDLGNSLNVANSCFVADTPDGVSKDNCFAVVATNSVPDRYVGQNKVIQLDNNGDAVKDENGKYVYEVKDVNYVVTKTTGSTEGEDKVADGTAYAASLLKENCTVFTLFSRCAAGVRFNDNDISIYLSEKIASGSEYANARAQNNSDPGGTYKSNWLKTTLGTTILESMKPDTVPTFTVTDPMGEYIELVSTSLTDTSAQYDSVKKTITWTPTAPSSTDGDTISFTLKYTVKLNTGAEGFEYSKYYPTNGDTLIKFKDGDAETTKHFIVPGVKAAESKTIYIVNYIWNGEYIADSKTFDCKVGDVIKYGGVATDNSVKPVKIEGYTAKQVAPSELKISDIATNNVINFYYYKNVEITAKSDSVVYDGKEHSVSGFTGAPKDADFSAITVGAKGTEEGTYPAEFAENTVSTVDKTEKYIITKATDGQLEITSRPYHPNPSITDKITVEITGNSDSVVYDGTEHSVKDYTVKISDSRYTEKDFTFSGKALASGVNAGAYEMGLKADQFKNTNARFTNVEFIIKADGVLTITQRPLTITAGSAEGIAPVTCDKYTVEGLATGDKVDSVKITGIQSEPGESPNVASDAVIKNAKGEDVTANYKITYVNGVLKAIEVLNKEIHFNYVIGYTDGTIRPSNNISRAEVATIFFRLLTDEAREQYTTTAGNFTDVKAGMWCNRAIATLTNMGIIKGYTDGSFQPNKSITRAELATIIARFAKLDVNTKTFSDINGHWAQKNIELAAGNGWINGYEDGTFRPNNNITRAETFAMINRVLDRQTESVSDLLPTSEMNMWSDNLNENAWYYKDVQEATNYHKCDRVGDSVYEKWTEKVPDIDWASYQI